MYLLRKRFSDQVYRTGIICIALSLGIFCLPFFITAKEDYDFGLFILNFCLTGFYLIYRWVSKETTSREARIHHQFLFLVLSLISAYSLNRQLPVFEDSADWFAGLLVLLCLNYMAFAWFIALPAWTRHLLSFINGAALMTFVYLSVYLMPLYLLSAIIFFMMGVSLHAFVPLLFTIYTLLWQRRISRRNKQYWISFGGGIATVLGVISLYLLVWNNSLKTINHTWQEARNNNAGLPDWVFAAQTMPRDAITQKILKSGLVYSIPDKAADNFLWRMPDAGGLEEKYKHDPLVMIASFFNNETIIDENSRLQILLAGKDISREEKKRLWPGDYLQTDFVNTEMKVWPRCNMAYTEKTITVRSDNAWTGSREEAIYTFYMPEGSVVTSLSLWVNGQEQKGILTTKARADSAYTAVVGVEKRDPSVVHWQQGNTVSVRVFPVLGGEKRMFKIGITSPLERVNGKLRYQNIYFKGPAADDAGENVTVDFEQPVHDFELPASFISKAQQSYSRKGKYQPDWGLWINDPGLSGCSFSFDGNEYSLSPYHKKLAQVDYTNLYLDINQAWTRDEFDKIIALSANKNVFVYDNGILQLTGSNKKEIWEKLSMQRFSLFPLYEIADAPHSLLITKHAPSALQLADLEESAFMSKTKDFFSRNEKINVFNLGDGLSPYLAALKEFRVFRYDNGDIGQLQYQLQKSQFPEDIENDSRVIIHATDMIVEKTPGMKERSGPDHVMRLFAYNHIMQQLGKGLWLDRPVEDSLVQEARTAYVVTPVSSLIVLETQADYDRFNINDAGNSLKNASLHSKGAVPEPHEWVLIGLVIILLVFVMRKRKMQHSL